MDWSFLQGARTKILADEYNYSGKIIKADDDGILIIDKSKVFVPWNEVLWIGENIKNYTTPEIIKMKKRIKRKTAAYFVIIYLLVIASALAIRWLK